MPGATSHLSAVLFWPDAIPLLGSQTGAVATEGGEGNHWRQPLAAWEGLRAAVPPGLGLPYPASLEEGWSGISSQLPRAHSFSAPFPGV